ncbi:MAG TPA: AAA family ATPase [Epulopiscium sp.]|nr:AAA family ATPase [Candidatus Epulonipiscium sp.]
MDIKLNWIHIKNFKGLKDFKLEAKGNNVEVFGDNATGKTSVIDSFLWLLFDKDSNDKADTNFTVKPQDELGQDINNLQTSVEAELTVDGQPLKLKKIREEKWVKRHGETEKTFDGHIKSYWFNEVPLKATTYKAKVDGLIDENIFKMITNPLYFNTKLSWEERREILLQISGDMTNDEVIASDENLSKLSELLNGRTIDEYKSVLADQLKGYKKERDNIPPRIDELTLALPQETQDYSQVEKDLAEFKEGLAQIDEYMTSAAKKTEDVNKKNQQLNAFKNELEEIKRKIKVSSGANTQKLISEKSELENGKILLSSGIKTLGLQIEQANKTLETNADARKELLDEWKYLKDSVASTHSNEFILEIDSTESMCPTCRQELPSENIEAQAKELEANFNKKKLAVLEKLVKLTETNKNKGLALKANTQKTELNLIGLQEELLEKEQRLKDITTNIAIVEKEIAEPVAEPNYDEDKQYILTQQAIDKLQAELDKPSEDDTAYMLKKKSEIQVEIDKLNTTLNSKTETEKKKVRIEELKAEEKRVSTLIAELEGNKHLLERFVVTKVNLMDENINKQFKYVKFKLFEENVTNEGIKETCIALINTNGSYIKFEDANSAGKINAGLDIINALCDFYKVTAPIFIDNRESVVKLADTESQVISLIVSEQDKTLRTEIIE